MRLHGAIGGRQDLSGRRGVEGIELLEVEVERKVHRARHDLTNEWKWKTTWFAGVSIDKDHLEGGCEKHVMETKCMHKHPQRRVDHSLFAHT